METATALSETQQSESSLLNCLPKRFSKKQIGSTEFRNRETEQVAQNIVVFQRMANPEFWTPFTWENHKARHKHKASSEVEHEILEKLVYGGRPVPESYPLEAGYLKKDSFGRYSVTEKFLRVIQPFMD